VYILIAGLVLFLGCHSISMVADNWRDHMVSRIGVLRWRGLYSLASALGLALLIWGYGLARQEPVVVYQPPQAMRHVTMLLMLPVFPVLAATYLPGRIRTLTGGHPMLTAIKLWALAHLLTNGMLADLLLFGSFLVWAGANRASQKRRRPRPTPTFPASRVNDLLAVVLGLALYGLLVGVAHGWLTGVPLLH